MTCLAVAALCALPAAAAETAKGTCTTSVGTNTVTYDCNYVSRGYEVATPLTLQMDYACSVRCGGVLAFGLSGPGFTPKGDVEGHVMSVQRGAGSMTFSLMFDKLHQDSSAQGNSNGTAFMTVLLNVDDGTGRFRPTALPFKVHVNSNAGSSGSN
jgi:hypothetical protein